TVAASGGGISTAAGVVSVPVGVNSLALDGFDRSGLLSGEEGGNTLRNAGTVSVNASGGIAAAIGMGAVGEGNHLENGDEDQPAQLTVVSSGGIAVGAGIAALGTENTVENYGEVTVSADGTTVAAALGLAAVDLGAEGSSTVHNHRSTVVTANAESDSATTVALGMGGLGSEVALENKEGAYLAVTAGGATALAAGMVTLGDDSEAGNAGDVKVTAVTNSGDEDEPDDWAVAIGMLGQGTDNTLWNAENASLD